VLVQDGEVHVTVDPSARSDSDRKRTGGSIRDLPGPRGVPLLGNLLELDIPRLHEVLEGWAAEYGPVYRYRLGRKWILALSDPDLIAQVLRARPETYRRLGNVDPVFREMGVDGVFSAEGGAWRPQRRLAMEALSPRPLPGFYPSLRSVAERLQRRWDGLAESGDPVEIVQELKRFTVDVTTLLTFGQDVNTVEQGEDLIQRRLEHVFPAMTRRLFALWPTWRLVRSPADRRLDRALREIRTWLRGLITDARARLQADPARSAEPSNFLEAMVTARDDEGRPFPDEIIFGNLITMLLAGEDTTAHTLAWAVHHLCESPGAVASLREELDRVTATSDLPGDLETANRLVYAGAVANEVMRLRPVAPLLYLQTNVATRLDGLKLPAGTPVAVLTRPAVLEATNFEDPHAFRPERWLDAPTGAHEPSAHIPFGSGPRLCPGRTLALLEMKVVLGALYKRFEVERHGRAEAVREGFAFTMYPKGLEVRLRPRGPRAVFA
jgi:cytochrome P450